MDRKMISEALGGIDGKYIREALDAAPSGMAYAPGKETDNMNKRKITRPARILLIAAVLAMVLAMGVGAYAADIFGFRALIAEGRMSYDEPSEKVVSLTQPQDSPEELGNAVSERLAASEAAWVEWSEYKTVSSFDLSEPEVFKNTPEGTSRMEVTASSDGSYTARYYDGDGELLKETAMSAEEYEAMRAYDDVVARGGIEGYDFNYNVCSSEEAAKLEEIAAKYGLALRREMNLAWSSETTGQSGEDFYTNEELTELTATEMGNSGNIFNEVPVGFDKVYWFDEGSFCVSYYVALPSSGEQVTCYGYNSMYGTLSSGDEVITTVNEENFTSREYTAADGTVLTIMENGSEAFIYAFLENSFYAQHIGSGDMTVEDVNCVADMINYSLIGK